MKFNKIYISEKITSKVGIAEINIQRLNNVVALVGRNGSGKSRILDILKNHLFEEIILDNLIDKSIQNTPNGYASVYKEYEDLLFFPSLDKQIQNLVILRQTLSDNELRKINKEIQDLKNLRGVIRAKGDLNIQRKLLQAELSEISKNLKPIHLRYINGEEVNKLQKALDNSTSDGEGSFENLLNAVIVDSNYDEFKAIHQGALSYLALLPHKLVSDEHKSQRLKTSFEETQSYKRFTSLKEYIYAFLNKELTWEEKQVEDKLTPIGHNVTYQGMWKLNGIDLNYDRFSDGEKTLFAFALMFFLLDQNPNLGLKDCIILMDEPELHLHPKAEIDLINGIRKVISDTGQLIIATHSINILSSLHYDEIFMVKDGKIKHPSGSTPGESLAELMGIDDRIEKLSEFLISISTWSYVNFMAQCFSNPEVIQSSPPHDPQVESFKRIVTDKFHNNSAMLLDFGAGMGRLYEQIKTDYDFLDKITYSALEPQKQFHEQLNALGVKSIYESYQELPKTTFDFILLCNVLHEIPLPEWEMSLNHILKALKPDGYLIIIEAKVLLKGEKVGKIGYLLLDSPEIQKLFGLTTPPMEINLPDSQDKVTCVVMNKSELNRVTKANIKEAMIELKESALNKIINLRSLEHQPETLHAMGRKSAFYSTQVINAQLAIEHIIEN